MEGGVWCYEDMNLGGGSSMLSRRTQYVPNSHGKRNHGAFKSQGD